MGRARQAAMRELRRRHRSEYLTLYRIELQREGVGPIGLGTRDRATHHG